MSQNEAAIKLTRDCLDPWTYVEVRPNGEVAPCCVRAPVGNLAKASLSEILSGEPIRALRLQLLTGDLDQVCSNCLQRGPMQPELLQTKVRALREEVRLPPEFNSDLYLQANPDVHQPAEEHFRTRGYLEGRMLRPEGTAPPPAAVVEPLPSPAVESSPAIAVEPPPASAAAPASDFLRLRRPNRAQQQWYRRFCHEVSAFRQRDDVSPTALALVDRVASMPFDPGFVRRIALAVMSNRAHRDPSTGNPFLFELHTLPSAAQEHLAGVIVSYFLTCAAGSWLFGRLLRRLRLDGLDLKTQAAVVIWMVAPYG